jgi:hypothetical protein
MNAGHVTSQCCRNTASGLFKLGFITINFGLRAVKHFVPPGTEFLYRVLSQWKYFLKKKKCFFFLVKEISPYRNKLSYCIHKSPRLEFILSQVQYACPVCLCKIHFNIILASMLRNSKSHSLHPVWPETLCVVNSFNMSHLFILIT